MNKNNMPVVGGSLMLLSVAALMLFGISGIDACLYTGVGLFASGVAAFLLSSGAVDE